MRPQVDFYLSVVSILLKLNHGWSQGKSNFYAGQLSIVSGGVDNFARNKHIRAPFIAFKLILLMPVNKLEKLRGQ